MLGNESHSLLDYSLSGLHRYVLQPRSVHQQATQCLVCQCLKVMVEAKRNGVTVDVLVTDVTEVVVELVDCVTCTDV